MGHRVAQLVEALRYTPKDGGFDSRCCHNPSGRSSTLGSTQTFTELSTRNITMGVNAAGV